jgi:2-dehydropantoate 2-reductase
MRTLIVGIGALGGIISARLLSAGSPVSLATRNSESAMRLKDSGLQVTGVGGAFSVQVADVASIGEYRTRAFFDLIVLATKAADAIEVAPMLSEMLANGATLLPIQNGVVSQVLAEKLGDNCVLGGLSNLGATMTAPGMYEQRNAGHLLIGEIGGGESERAERVRGWLGRGVDVRVTPNFRGALWSKLLLNCSVTTIGAIAGTTMREYIGLPFGRELFDQTYGEALRVALASGAQPLRMVVNPIPPGWNGHSVVISDAHDEWLGQILKSYGDLKPSMLQDFERGCKTEIDFINGHVVNLGRKLAIATPANTAIVETVRGITNGRIVPDHLHLGRIMKPILNDASGNRFNTPGA